ncbi:MAG: trigger factor [Pseudomonadota bacterium]
MQVSVETTEGLERKLTVKLPAEKIQGAVDERLNSLKGNVRLDGFRPGKVPFSVVKKRFGGQVRQEVLGEVIQSSFQEAVVSESLRPAGAPMIHPIDEENDVEEGGFGYTAVFEVFPEFELTATEELEIERLSAEVSDEDVDGMIDNLRKQRAEWEEVERDAKDGDQIMIDFTGTVDGEEFPGGSAQNTPLELGSGRMIPGFEDQLIGVKPGDERTINVTFPDDYQSEELAGKAADFAIKVHAVKEANVPELDAEFVKAFGIEDGDLEKFRSDITSNMERELEQKIQASTKSAVIAALSEANDVEIPNAMITDEVKRMRDQLLAQMQIPEGGDAPDLDDELFRDEAQQRVKAGLVIAEVIRTAELQAEPDKVREAIEKMASSYQDPQQVVNYYYQNEELMRNVEGMVLEQSVTDWVVERCKVNDKPASFQEVMSAASVG